MRRVWSREIDGGVNGWEKEGDWKEREREIERERRGSETDVPKLYTYNEYEHSVIITNKSIEIFTSHYGLGNSLILTTTYIKTNGHIWL